MKDYFTKKEIEDMRQYIEREIKPNGNYQLKKSTAEIKTCYAECSLCKREFEYKMSFDTMKPAFCPECGNYTAPCRLCLDYFNECLYNKCPIRYIIDKRIEVKN